LPRTKSDKLYHTIGEVAGKLGVQPHVLRYWENEFKQLRPKRNSSGSRKYRQEDIETLREIKRLLHVEKYTMEGAKKKMQQSSRSKRSNDPEEDLRKAASEVRLELEEILSLLQGD
jgi:DNA-binding transcriptional MerR regulator